MALPNISIPFQNGALASFAPSPDAVFGAMLQMEAIGTITLGSCYRVTSLPDVEDLGLIDSIDNHVAYKFFAEFYAETGPGAELFFMAIAKTALYTTYFAGATPLAKTLADFAQRKLRGLFVVMDPDVTYTPVVTSGIDDNVAVLKTAAQSFLENYTTDQYAPMFAILDGYLYSGTDTALLDLALESNNRVGVMIGNTEKRTGPTAAKGTAMGVLAGRLAAGAIQENIGKVKNGALKPLVMYIVDALVDVSGVGAIHDKGYITFRTHVGKTGYFFTDDPLATAVADDYKSLARRRIADKAYRIAYSIAIEELLNDVDVNADGTIDAIYAKTLEGQMANAIYNQMALNGELSLDKTNAKDKGCIIKIDLGFNVTSSSKLRFEAFQVKPKGYLKFIDIPLGFVPVTI